MSKNQINSLYELIKQVSQQKGRPLKIICDWDKVIQPINPKIWYDLAKQKGWTINVPSFEEFFSYYWENARVEFEGSTPWTKYTTIKEVEEIRNKNNKEQMKELVWDPLFEIMNGPNYYEEAPILSCAEVLIKCLDENLISNLIFISASSGIDSRKRKVFTNLFNPWLDKCQFFLRESKEKAYHNTRAYWIRQSYPDFDIFIDDSPQHITETKELFKNDDKYYASPDYKCYRHKMPQQDSNFLIFPTYLTDISPTKKIERIKQTTEKDYQRERGIIMMLITFLIISWGIFFVIILSKRKKK